MCKESNSSSVSNSLSEALRGYYIFLWPLHHAINVYFVMTHSAKKVVFALERLDLTLLKYYIIERSIENFWKVRHRIWMTALMFHQDLIG